MFILILTVFKVCFMYLYLSTIIIVNEGLHRCNECTDNDDLKPWFHVKVKLLILMDGLLYLVLHCTV